MPGFALRNPHTVIVGALVVLLLGVTAFARMPVDVFPNLKMPAVVVATFYPGMPPLEIERDITTRFERFFTLGSDIEHIESRSLPGSASSASSSIRMPTSTPPPRRSPIWRWPICAICRRGRCRRWC